MFRSIHAKLMKYGKIVRNHVLWQSDPAKQPWHGVHWELLQRAVTKFRSKSFSDQDRPTLCSRQVSPERLLVLHSGGTHSLTRTTIISFRGRFYSDAKPSSVRKDARSFVDISEKPSSSFSR